MSLYQDRFATSHSKPTLDASQDYVLVSGQEANGRTIIKFKRQYKTKDSHDLPFEVTFSLIDIYSFKILYSRSKCYVYFNAFKTKIVLYETC